MIYYVREISLKSNGGVPTYSDITNEVEQTIKESGADFGLCLVSTTHTTCSVFYEEYVHDKVEDGREFLQKDLDNVLEKLVHKHLKKDDYIYPGELHYEAVRSWDNWQEYLPNNDESALFNADAHIKATILGSNQTFEIFQGKLKKSITGYVYFVDFDVTRPRNRKVRIIVMGGKNDK